MTHLPGHIIVDTETDFRLRPHCPSPSRIFTGNQVLGPLTDRKIEEYRKAGKYGPVEPVRTTGPKCRDCDSTKKVRRLDYSYLPHPGYYCASCVHRYRQERDQERKLAALVRERRRGYE